MLFPKADLPAIDGVIPGKNFIQWAKIIGRPSWWPLLLLVPIVNIFIFAGMAVDLVRSFGQYKLKHSAGAVFYAPAALALLAKNDSAKYIGPNYLTEKAYLDEVKALTKAGDKNKLARLNQKSPYKKSAGREWIESIFFAVFAAAFIRMFLIEAFVIPTPSMEGSLMVGDFLFVSKVSYGIRTPMTIAMIPLLHNRIPKTDSESYFKKPSLDYYRLPALEEIGRNKPIVFNWPVGDSVYITSNRSYTVGQVSREPAYTSKDKELRSKVRKKDFVVRPLDKKDHYIKRCVAVPGDKLEIKNRQIYINGEPGVNPSQMQFLNKVEKEPQVQLQGDKLKEWGIGDTQSDFAGNYGFYITEDQREKLKSIEGLNVSYHQSPIDGSKLFPHDAKITKGWSVDNYGPVWIPKAGETIDLTVENLPFYRRIIDVYEDNELLVKGNQISINGQPADTYTFKQDYYWAMGDNRHNSEDSRMWGYVPHDHIVGKPLFIWFSTRNARLFDGIRFNRLFKSANVD
jgi:signal peptidase I